MSRKSRRAVLNLRPNQAPVMKRFSLNTYLVFGVFFLLMVVFAATFYTCQESETRKHRDADSLPLHAQPTPLLSSNHVRPAPAIFDQRRQIRNEWLDAARRVAQDANDPVAWHVYELLSRSSALAMPISSALPCAVQVIDTSYQDPRFPSYVFVVMMSGDEKLDSCWARKYAGTNAVEYVPDVRTISVNTSQLISWQFMGLMLLHEGFHFLQDLKNPGSLVDLSPQTEGYHELAAYSFGFRLLSAIGGSAYQLLLEEQIARLRNQYELQNNLPVNLIIWPDYSIRDDFEILFGGSRSDFEKDLRLTMCWLHAIYALIDRNPGLRDKENAKALVTYSIYMHNRQSLSD